MLRGADAPHFKPMKGIIMKKLLLILGFIPLLSYAGESNKPYTINDVQTQSQKQGQQQGQIAVSNSALNNDVNIDTGNHERIPVNSAIAPNIYPTAPCMGSSSIAGGGALISIAGGTSWESKDCMLLETARSFEQAGLSDDALAIRCKSKYAEGAPSCSPVKKQKSPKNCVHVFADPLSQYYKCDVL